MSSNELYVKSDDTHRRVLYLVREFLKDRTEINVVSHFKGAFTVSRACNSLVDLNYAEFGNVRTLTEVVEGRRRIKFEVKLTKGLDFDRLYKENQEKREEFLKQRENEKNEKEVTPGDK